MRRTVRGSAALLAAGILIVGLGACGGDDDDTDAGGDAANEADGGELAAGDAAEDATAFCESVIALDRTNLGLESGEATPDDVDAALQAAQDAAPAAILDAVTTAVTETRTVAEESSSAPPDGPPVLPSDAFYPAAVEIGGFVGDNCDLETLDVTATDYAFAGFAETVPSGTTVINFANDGAEFHEMVLMKIADGEERPLEELLALPEEEANSLVTSKGFVIAPPGAGNFVTADLDPGRYVALCFVPVGATPEAMASGAPLDEADGHMAHGMVAEFEVT
jgi:hypothetical protein